MLSVIGSLIGFASSTAPAIADHFKQKSNQKFELEKIKTMAELRKAGFDHELKAFEAQASDKEHDRLIQHDMSMNSGTGIISALQRSVRPVITYCFFALFVAIKVVALLAFMDNGSELGDALTLIWDDATAGLFAAIMSFWFGNRAVSKYVKGKL